MPNSLADQLKVSEHLVTVAKANAAELEGLDEFTTRLETLIPQVKEMSVRQLTAQAVFQQATRDLDALKKEAQELTARLRGGVKAMYGYKAEKLVEFGLKPLRKRTRIKAEKKPPETAPPSRAEKEDDAT